MDGSTVIFPILLLVGIATGLLFGAIILRLSCSACSVKDPPLPNAVMIVFLTVAATALAGLVFGWLAPSGTAHPDSPIPFAVAAAAILLTVHMLVSAGMYRFLIPTSFKRGIRVWLTQFAISSCFALIVVLVLALVLILIDASPPDHPSQPRTAASDFAPN